MWSYSLASCLAPLLAVVPDEHVGGLEVTVQQASAVGRRESPADGDEMLHDCLPGVRPLLQPRLECPPGDVLHHDGETTPRQLLLLDELEPPLLDSALASELPSSPDSSLA